MEAAWLSLGCALLIFNGLFEFSLQIREFMILLGLLSGGATGLVLSARRASSVTAQPRLSPPALARGMTGIILCGFCFASALVLTPPLQIATFYTRWGDAFAWSCVVAWFGYVVVIRRRHPAARTNDAAVDAGVDDLGP